MPALGSAVRPEGFFLGAQVGVVAFHGVFDLTT